MTEETEPASADEEPVKRRVPWPVIRGTVKVMIVILVLYFVAPGAISGFRNALHKLTTLNPAFLGAGFALELSALLCYSLLTLAALPPGSITTTRLFRIQLSTKALSNVMPGGSAASSALGYRLITLSGVQGADTGFALATVGLGSAVVLNLILLATLAVSIPIHGVNAGYGKAALIGVILIGLFALLVVGLVKGQARSEKIVRALASRLRFQPDKAVTTIRHMVVRMREFFDDRQLLRRVLVWAVANWVLDAAAMWVFLRAFGASLSIDGLLVAFCLGNVAGVIPLTPGGIGIVDAVLVSTSIGFGATPVQAALGVASYRLAQYWLPIMLGAGCYLSLRVGPWSIENRLALLKLRDEAKTMAEDDTSGLEWASKYGAKPVAPMQQTVPGDVLIAPKPVVREELHEASRQESPEESREETHHDSRE